MNLSISDWSAPNTVLLLEGSKRNEKEVLIGRIKGNKRKNKRKKDKMPEHKLPGDSNEVINLKIMSRSKTGGKEENSLKRKLDLFIKKKWKILKSPVSKKTLVTRNVRAKTLSRFTSLKINKNAGKGEIKKEKSIKSKSIFSEGNASRQVSKAKKAEGKQNLIGKVAKLEVRLDKIEVCLDEIEVRLDKIEVCLDEIEVRLDKIEVCLDKIEVRLDKIEVRLDKIEVCLDKIEVCLDEIKDSQFKKFDEISNNYKLLLRSFTEKMEQLQQNMILSRSLSRRQTMQEQGDSSI